MRQTSSSSLRLVFGVLLGASVIFQAPLSASAASTVRKVANAPAVVGSSDDLAGEEKDERAAVLARDWGIELVGLRSSAFGRILDFRYEVVDVEKAKQIFGPRIVPLLLDPETGAVLVTSAPPQVGALRQTRHQQNVEKGRHYFILFSNPGGYLKAGKKVQIRIGDLQIDDVVIQ